MKSCPSCDTELPDDVDFCTNCGTDLADAAKKKDDEYKQFWIIMVGTMMRIGEAMALHWSDVNLEKNYVSITKQFHYVFGRPTVEAPKSKSSI